MRFAAGHTHSLRRAPLLAIPSNPKSVGDHESETQGGISQEVGLASDTQVWSYGPIVNFFQFLTSFVGLLGIGHQRNEYASVGELSFAPFPTPVHRFGLVELRAS